MINRPTLPHRVTRWMFLGDERSAQPLMVGVVEGCSAAAEPARGTPLRLARSDWSPAERAGAADGRNVMALSIIKTHGSLNDIFVIDGAPGDHFAEADVPRAVELLCDRRRGLGGDGVYFIADNGDGTAQAFFYNPDGSPSLLCGNGMRGAGRLLLDRYQAETSSCGPAGTPSRSVPRDYCARCPAGLRGAPPIDFTRSSRSSQGPSGPSSTRRYPPITQADGSPRWRCRTHT